MKTTSSKLFSTWIAIIAVLVPGIAFATAALPVRDDGRISNGPNAIGTKSSPDASAILDVVSTTKGALLPRMTTTQKNAIASPQTGLLVYDTSVGGLFMYNGAAWKQISADGLSPNFAALTVGSLSGVGHWTAGVVSASNVLLGSEVSGTLPTTNGGTGQTSLNSTVETTLYQTIATTLGDLVVGGASGAPIRLAGNTTTTPKFLKSLGSGGLATAPTWAQPAFSDLSGTASLTTQVTGILPAANGGFGADMSAVTLPTSGTYLSNNNVVNVSGKSFAQTLSPVTDATYSLGASESFQWANLFLSSYVDQKQISTPSSPGAGHNLFYFKSDDKAYIKNSAGTEAALLTAATIPSTRAANLIINGAMNWWQRATTRSFPANESAFVYVADRFAGYNGNDGVFSIAQSSDVPSGQGFNLSAKIDVTSTDSSIGAGQLGIFRYGMEGLDYQSVAQKTFTICYWAKAGSGTPTVSMALKNSAGTRSYVVDDALATTWTQYCHTIAADTSGTWLLDTGVGMYITWAFAAGSTWQTTPNAWQTGNYYGTSNTSNFMASTATDLYITGVQLNVNDAVQPFMHYGGGASSDLLAAQRYYQCLNVGNGAAESSTAVQLELKAAPYMRTTPSLGVTGVIEITDAVTANYTQSSGNISNVNIGANGGRVKLANFSGLTTFRYYNLETNTGTCIKLDAEF